MAPQTSLQDPSPLKSDCWRSEKRRKLEDGWFLLSQEPNAGRKDLDACASTTRAFAWIGRYLSILITLMLNKMSVTEHFGTWDRFLQGDRDLELGTITVLSPFCPVLVLSKSYKQCVGVLLSAGLVSSLNSTIYSCQRFTGRDHFRLLEDFPRLLRVRKFSKFTSRYDRPHLERLNTCGRWFMPGRSTRLLFV